MRFQNLCFRTKSAISEDIYLTNSYPADLSRYCRFYIGIHKETGLFGKLITHVERMYFVILSYLRISHILASEEIVRASKIIPKIESTASIYYIENFL